MMARHLAQDCDKHASPWECTDFVVIRADNGEYRLPIRDGPNGSAGSSLPAWHCPWCGQALAGHRTHPGPPSETPQGKALTEIEVVRRRHLWDDGVGGMQTLHEFLGWTFDEYARWVQSGELPTE